jgi:hypothetical protein
LCFKIRLISMCNTSNKMQCFFCQEWRKNHKYSYHFFVLPQLHYSLGLCRTNFELVSRKNIRATWKSCLKQFMFFVCLYFCVCVCAPSYLCCINSSYIIYMVAPKNMVSCLKHGAGCVQRKRNVPHWSAFKRWMRPLWKFIILDDRAELSCGFFVCRLCFVF